MFQYINVSYPAKAGRKFAVEIHWARTLRNLSLEPLVCFGPFQPLCDFTTLPLPYDKLGYVIEMQADLLVISMIEPVCPELFPSCEKAF